MGATILSIILQGFFFTSVKMKKKKIKLFLGGYLNYTNAQNLNCLALAKHLDSSRFKAYSLNIHSFPRVMTSAILFNCFYPFNISSILGLFWGVIKCDVLYLPKHTSTPNWIIYIAKLLRKKIFTTIENNMCDVDKESMLNSFGDQKRLKKHFKYIPNIFGITRYIIENADCGVKLEKKVLYLGVEIDLFSQRERERLRNIVFVGSLTKRKRVGEVLQLAENFPDITFHIIGDGVCRDSLQVMAPNNVILLGQLNQKELALRLNEMDLLFLPSKSEGFPKVILEAAASGVPSLVYSDYGASEWITDMENGFLINNFEQSIECVRSLLSDPNLLIQNSRGAILMAKKFDWKIVVKDWEKVILNLR